MIMFRRQEEELEESDQRRKRGRVSLPSGLLMISESNCINSLLFLFQDEVMCLRSEVHETKDLQCIQSDTQLADWKSAFSLPLPISPRKCFADFSDGGGRTWIELSMTKHVDRNSNAEDSFSMENIEFHAPANRTFSKYYLLNICEW
jgi:hypothetical protein